VREAPTVLNDDDDAGSLAVSVLDTTPPKDKATFVKKKGETKQKTDKAKRRKTSVGNAHTHTDYEFEE
jgi:hypothetical protein